MQGRRQKPESLTGRRHGSTRLAKRGLHLSADITCRVGAENRGEVGTCDAASRRHGAGWAPEPGKIHHGLHLSATARPRTGAPELTPLRSTRPTMMQGGRRNRGIVRHGRSASRTCAPRGRRFSVNWDQRFQLGPAMPPHARTSAVRAPKLTVTRPPFEVGPAARSTISPY